MRLRGWKRLLVAILMLMGGCVCATLPFIMMLSNQRTVSNVVVDHEREAETLAQSQIDMELNEAAAYNERLYADGQKVLGEAVDPWSGRPVSLDDDYRGQLDMPADGIMATVEYPRLGINLPIRHGTDDATLNNGVGHLYGSSLPVGGVNTHAVLSAHSGLADRLMFDRLSLREGRVGDVFYLHVLGRTLAYTVSDIRVIAPDDFSRLRIDPGQDEVTLLTCTPYGINTQRLLVTGVRTTMPDPAPLPEDAPTDRGRWVMTGWILGVWLFVTAVVVVHMVRLRRAGRRGTPRHEA